MKAKSKQQSLGKHPLNPPQEGDKTDIPLLRGTEGVSNSTANPLSTGLLPLNPPQEGDLADIPLLRGNEGGSTLRTEGVSNTRHTTHRFTKYTSKYLKQNNINFKGLIFSNDFLPYNPQLKERSRILRKEGEKAEAMLWKCLKSKQLGVTFSRQKPILNYIADFYCKELNLIIEIDGAAHFSEAAQEYDKERDRQMRCLDLTIVRIADRDVRKNPQHVARYIYDQYVVPNTHFMNVSQKVLNSASNKLAKDELPLNPPQEGDFLNIPLLRGTEGVSTLRNEGVSKSKSPLTSTDIHPLNPPQEGDLTNIRLLRGDLEDIPLLRGTEGVFKSKSPLTSTDIHPLNPPQEGDLTNLPLLRGTEGVLNTNNN